MSFALINQYFGMCHMWTVLLLVLFDWVLVFCCVFFFQKRSASSFGKYKCVFALIFVRLKFKSSVKCNVKK